MNATGHLRSVRRRFSAAAATYEGNARVQSHAAEQVLHGCADVSPSAILEAGCGTGMLTRGLRRLFPAARLDALDLSEKMIQRARAQLPAVSDVVWHVADVATFVSDRAYDLAASNCALHWTEPLVLAFRQLHGLLRPGGRLVFSLMLRDTFCELHAARLAAAPSKPPASRLPRLEDVAAALRDAGFQIREMREDMQEEYFPSAREFLRVIRQTGLTGGGVSRAARPLTRGELERLMAIYEDRHRGSLGLRCTYHLGFLHALKP